MNRKIVRCSEGALYSTIWIPLVSLKALRLGGRRRQRCPVHHKWEQVELVDPSRLTPEQRAEAESVRDLPIP
jgi:hypothetical protein